MEQDRLEVVIAAQANQANTALKQLVGQINNCAAAVTSLTNNFNNLGNTSLNNTAKGIKKIDSGLNGFASKMSKVSRSMSSVFNVGRIYLMWNVTKRLRDTLYKCVTLSVDFIETTNKFEVSMGRNVDKAYKFQDALAGAFGTARTDMMEFQATFNNIMSAIPRFKRRGFLWDF